MNPEATVGIYDVQILNIGIILQEKCPWAWTATTELLGFIRNFADMEFRMLFVFPRTSYSI